MPPKRGRGRGTRGRGDGPDRAAAPSRPVQREPEERGYARDYESRPSRPPADVYRPPARRGRPSEEAGDGGRRQEPQVQEFAPPRREQMPPKVQPVKQEKPAPSRVQPELLSSMAGLSLEPEPPKSRQITKMAARQPPGTLGRPIDLYANYFLLKFKNVDIFHYDVDIVFIRQYRLPDETEGGKGAAGKKPAKGQSVLKEGRTAKEDAEKKVSHVEHQQKRAPGKQRCRQIIAEMLKDPRLRSFNPVYDGQKNLYTTKKLPIEDKKEGVSKFPIKLEEEGSNKEFEVTVKPVIKEDGSNLINLAPLFELYQGRSCEVSHEVIMAFDTVMCHRSPPFSQIQVGRSFFLLNDTRHQLGEGMEIWFGYNQSVHLTQRGPAVIVNFAAKAFHQDGNVIDCACDILRDDITKKAKLFPNEIKALEEALTKVRVEVIHQKYPRKYPVKGLTKTSAKDTRFKVDDKEMSVADYFRQNYKPLRFPHLPCLHMRTSKNTTYMPMEVCRIFAGQPKLGKLSGRMTSDMIKKTAITPQDRFDKIWGNANLIEQVSGKLMKEFGLLMELKFMQLQGRVIGPPKLAYKATERGPTLADVDQRGTWRMDGKQFFRSKSDACTWMLLSFAGDRFCGMDKLENFARVLCNSARNLGINLERPNEIRIFRSHEKTRFALEFAKRQDVTFAVVVLSSRDQSHSYEEVKFVADIQLHLITQCMDDQVVVKKFNPQVATNVLLKINSKLGGVNHTLSQKPVIFSRPIIVFGADAAHSPRGYACPSIAAVVGSLDAFPSRYAVTCRVQQNPDDKKLSQEIIIELKAMVKEILRAFLANTRGKKPEKVVFFRDGVSEGQFNTVLENEINMVQYACMEELGFVPPLTFIVVQKRHQTRFRPRNPKDGVGRPGNVPPGTTVDTDVVHPVFFDFFLCSHEGIQGTSKPAHYTILYDDNKMSSDELQKLCYHLCHMYVRCNRSISVPAPVMYAHLACTRAKKYADLYLKSDAASVSSGSSGETRRLPPDIVEAITGMGNFEPGMFYV